MTRAATLSRSLAVVLLLGACSPSGSDAAPAGPAGPAGPAAPAQGGATAPAGRATAVFAMGCFWCAEADLEKLDEVLEVVSGYTGGPEANPTYEQVSAHRTGHYEAVRVAYDPAKVSYEKLLDAFWHNVDPFDGGGQFCDRGEQYRAAIFVAGDEQRRLAEASKQRVARQLGKPVVVEVLPAARFWDAEEYHQDYAARNPLRYRFYRNGCGRDARLRAVWGEAAGGH